MGSDAFSDSGSQKADIKMSARPSSHLETGENRLQGSQVAIRIWFLVLVYWPGVSPLLKPTLQPLNLQSWKQLIKSSTSYPPCRIGI